MEKEIVNCRIYEYFSVLRPVSIGTCPKAGLVNFENYERRRYVPEIGREAWGRLWYDRPLTDSEQRSYDLMQGRN